MKMTIVWHNGDIDKIDIPENAVENIRSGKVISHWDEWRFLMKGGVAGINMQYARKFYLEED